MQKNIMDNIANLSFLFCTKDLIEIIIEIKVITKILYKDNKYLVGTQLSLCVDQPLGSMTKIDGKKVQKV